MFSDKLQKRLKLLEDDLFEASDEQLRLKEKSESGHADLTLELKYPCILFTELEKISWSVFRNRKCADHIVYEHRDGEWVLHVFEFKRTIGKYEWMAMKEQFKGAIQNALAIAGVLAISVKQDQIRVYSVFRNDRLNDYANPAKLRMEMHEKEHRDLPEDCEDWNDRYAKIDFPDTEMLLHKKIQLDVENGTGRTELA